MAFSVEITDPARDDIDNAVAFIARKSQPAARKWKTELQVLILLLREMPGRFAVIPEATELGLPYRSAPHHSHRVIFRVEEQKNTVYVVRVYHGSRRPLSLFARKPFREVRARPIPAFGQSRAPTGPKTGVKCRSRPTYGWARATFSSSSTPRPGSREGMT